MTHIGLMTHVDPYLLTIFYRPKELKFFASPPPRDPENPEAEAVSGVVWSIHQGWTELDLTDEGRQLAATIVAQIAEHTQSVHEDNDYPSLIWVTDDQLNISVHPLDRPTVFQAVYERLQALRWKVIDLPGMGGVW